MIKMSLIEKINFLQLSLNKRVKMSELVIVLIGAVIIVGELFYMLLFQLQLD